MSLKRLWRRGKRMLKNLEISAVALAGRPSHGLKFAVVKAKDDKDLAADLEGLLPEDEDREKLIEIAGKLPDEIKVEFQKNLDIITENIDIITPDLEVASMQLVAEALASVELGPSGNDVSLGVIQKTVDKYADIDEDLTEAFSYFQELSKSGLPGVEYGDLEEEEEDEDGAYISKYGNSYVPGQKIIEDDEVRLAKAKSISWPSLQISPTEIEAHGGQLKFVGKSVFARPEEEEDENAEVIIRGNKLSDKQAIIFLKEQVKELSRSRSKQILSDGGGYPNDLKKSEDDVFSWPSLCSGD